MAHTTRGSAVHANHANKSEYYHLDTFHVQLSDYRLWQIATHVHTQAHGFLPLFSPSSQL